MYNLTTKLTAFLLPILMLFAFWKPEGQPNDIPETRLPGCGCEALAPDQYGIWPTREFTTATPQSERVDAKQLDARLWLTKTLCGGAQHTDSLLVLRHGKLVYENYFNGYDENKPHELWSITKSFTSALTGIAIGDGLIEGLDQKVIDFFPDAVIAPGQESKRDMTVGHLLTMTSGLDTKGKWSACKGADDFALRAFELPQANPPGKQYYYDDIAPSILLGMIARASGKNVLDYANEKLFGPIGITSARWDTTDDGLPIGAFGLALTPRDMLRFGYLYLNEGRWEDRQIIPREWVLQTPPKTLNPRGYGLMFWNNRWDLFQGFYEANGADGQFISVYPSLDMVVVRTGDDPSFGYTASLLWVRLWAH